MNPNCEEKMWKSVGGRSPLTYKSPRVALFASLAFKLEVECRPADAVRTLAVDQVLATYFLKRAVPMLQNGSHRVVVFGL
jgi:hypothetical protein